MILPYVSGISYKSLGMPDGNKVLELALKLYVFHSSLNSLSSLSNICAMQKATAYLLPSFEAKHKAYLFTYAYQSHQIS